VSAAIVHIWLTNNNSNNDDDLYSAVSTGYPTALYKAELCFYNTLDFCFVLFFCFCFFFEHTKILRSLDTVELLLKQITCIYQLLICVNAFKKFTEH